MDGGKGESDLGTTGTIEAHPLPPPADSAAPISVPLIVVSIRSYCVSCCSPMPDQLKVSVAGQPRKTTASAFASCV